MACLSPTQHINTHPPPGLLAALTLSCRLGLLGCRLIVPLWLFVLLFTFLIIIKVLFFFLEEILFLLPLQVVIFKDLPPLCRSHRLWSFLVGFVVLVGVEILFGLDKSLCCAFGTEALDHLLNVVEVLAHAPHVNRNHQLLVRKVRREGEFVDEFLCDVFSLLQLFLQDLQGLLADVEDVLAIGHNVLFILGHRRLCRHPCSGQMPPSACTSRCNGEHREVDECPTRCASW
mmetsp:Transcript_140473/g.447798  ORF Transcript_140473/g.447798 Transcript_140473/m.447798 type:complete len:231 (+) Transcript_140473:173-865(+)